MSMLRRRPINALLVLAILVVAIVIAADPINRLAIKLSWNSVGTMGWENGLWSIVNLPASAKPEDVVRARLGPAFGLKGSYRILEIKQIWIYGSISSPLFAALVDCDQGKQIYVFHHNFNGNWGIRNYDP